MLACITSKQFREWQDYYEIEPFGEERADWRAGMLASILVNINLKQGATPTKPSDFMPKFGEEAGEQGQQSAEEMKSVLRQVTKSFQAEQRRKGGQ